MRSLLALMIAILIPQGAHAATFPVTSSSCEGAGSLREAIALANASPGTDDIDIQAGLAVNLWSCTRPSGVNLTDWYAITVTESVNIRGNGATLDGQLTWIDTRGNVRPKDSCPRTDATNLIVTLAPKFLQVGPFQGDAAGIEVTLDGITVQNVQQFAMVRRNGTLKVTNAVATHINDIFDCTNSAFVGEAGSLMDIRDSRVTFTWAPNAANIPTAAISGSRVVLKRVLMADNRSGAAVNADGNSSIVSSRLVASGGVAALRGATVNVVNTAIVRGTFSTSVWDQLYSAGAGSRLNFIASSYGQLTNGCQFQSRSCEPSTLLAQNGGVVNLEASAVGVAEDTLATLDLIGADTGGTLVSDAKTWIQATPAQNAAAIAALLPAALTATPGLPTVGAGFTNIGEALVVPVNPGQLINAIADSACPAGANRLIDPSDGSCIAVDVLGKPRVDATGKRTIGAIQVGESPHLFVTASNDASASLYWAPPFDTATLDGYAVTYRRAGSSDAFTRVSVSGGNQLTATIFGLTNGTAYEFYVTPVQGGIDLAGLRSNAAQATPYATSVAGPAISGSALDDATVRLFWTEPDLGGHPGPPFYTVLYRPAGSATWLSGPSFLSARTTTIGGLSSDAAYEFAVFATGTDGFATGTGTTTVSTLALPTISALSPSQGTTAGGTTITLTGTGFAAGTTTVSIGGQPCTGVTVISATTLTCTTPAGAAGTASVTVTTTAGTSNSLTFTYVVAVPQVPPTLSYANPSTWTQNTPLTLTPSVGQLQGSGAYAITSGSLPTGLSLAPGTGVISGTPSAQQATSATIRLTDGATGLFAEATVALTIVAPSPSPQLWYPTIQATVGTGPVNATPTRANIPAGAAYSVVTGGSLPPGFTLDGATGVISGTPTTAPGRVVAISIQACWGGCNPLAGEVRVAQMLFWIVPRLQYPVSTTVTAGVASTITPVVDLWGGGVFSIASGSLPAGMSLNPATGVISGTPQAPQDVQLTLRYSTGVNVLEPPLEYVYATARIIISSPTITLSYPAVAGQVGVPLSVSPTVTGLTGSPAFALVGGALPSGLTLDPATGTISGTPTGPPGSYPVTIEVRGSYGSQRTTVAISVAARTTFSGNSATGSGAITASFTGGGAACSFSVSRFVSVGVVPVQPPPGITFPHGLFDFTTSGCTPGGTLNFTLTFPSALPPGTAYWKYGPTPGNAVPHWYVLPATFAGNTVTFSVTDGGLGDDDLTANGTVVDPGGPGVGGGGDVVAIPTLSQWGLLLLSSILAGLGMLHLRRRD